MTGKPPLDKRSGKIGAILSLLVLVPFSPARLSAQGTPRAEMNIQLASRVVRPGEALRGRVGIEITDFSQPESMKVLGIVSDAVGGILHGGPTVLQPADAVYPFTGANGPHVFSLGRDLPLRAPNDPGEYYVSLALTGPPISNVEEWVRITVTDKPRRIRVDDNEFGPYPPTKDQPSTLNLRFTVEGIPAGAPGPGEVSVDVKLERVGSPDANGQVPWRIGYKRFNDLVNQGSQASGLCRVRLTPRMATRYKLLYTVSCPGYEPAEGMIFYTARDPGRGPAPALNPADIEWVRAGDPEIIQNEWPRNIPDIKLFGTSTMLELFNLRAIPSEISSLAWDEPPALIKPGQRVPLTIRKGSHGGKGLGAKWTFVCPSSGHQGSEFLATFDPKSAVTYSAEVHPALSGGSPSEPVRFFLMDAGPWDSSTHLYVYWRYLPRKIGSVGPLPPDELPDLPSTAGSGAQGTTSGGSGPVSGAGPTPPPAPGAGATGGGGTGLGGWTSPPAKTPGGGARPPAAAGGPFTGTWTSTNNDRGEVILQQVDDNITGSYGKGWGKLSGKVVGRVAFLEWRDRNGQLWGGAKFTLSDDGLTFKGSYNEFKPPDVAMYPWDAKRVVK